MVTRSSISTAVEVGTPDLVRAPIRPVDLARGHIQRDACRGHQPGGDEVLDTTAVEVGTPDLVRAPIRPVDLAAGHIQRDACRGHQPGGDEVFDIAAVEVGTPDLVRAIIRPVHPAAGHIQRDACRAGCDEVLDAAAVEVGTLDLGRVLIHPVHLPRSRRRGRSDGYAHAAGAVVLDAFAADAGRAGPVVPGAFTGRGGQPDRLGAGARSGQGVNLTGADLGIFRGNRRIGGAVPAQGGRRRRPRALVADRGAQREGFPRGQAAVADRDRLHHQVRRAAGHLEGVGLQNGAVRFPPQLHRGCPRRAAGQVDRLAVLARDIVVGFGRATVAAAAAAGDPQPRGFRPGVGHHGDRLAGLHREPVPDRVVGQRHRRGVGRQRRGRTHRLSDTGRQSGSGRIVEPGDDVRGVGQVDPAVGVDVPQEDVAVVGQDDAEDLAVQGHQQGVGEIDPSVVVDVAEDAARRSRLGRGGAPRSFDDETQRGHARFDPEGGVDAGDQPRTRDRQPVDRTRFPVPAPGIAFQAGRRRAPARSNPRLPVDQQHAPACRLPVADQAVDVHPCAHRLPGRIGGVPIRGVETGRLLPVNQGGNALSQEVEHLQPHVHRGRQLVRNHRGRVERVGIVRPQLEALQQSSRQAGQGQGEMTGPVRARRPRRGAQVGQVEQQHLGAGHRGAGGQPDMALELGAGRRMTHDPTSPDNADCGQQHGKQSPPLVSHFRATTRGCTGLIAAALSAISFAFSPSSATQRSGTSSGKARGITDWSEQEKSSPTEDVV